MSFRVGIGSVFSGGSGNISGGYDAPGGGEINCPIQEECDEVGFLDYSPMIVDGGVPRRRGREGERERQTNKKKKSKIGKNIFLKREKLGKLEKLGVKG